MVYSNKVKNNIHGTDSQRQQHRQEHSHKQTHINTDSETNGQKVRQIQRHTQPVNLRQTDTKPQTHTDIH